MKDKCMQLSVDVSIPDLYLIRNYSCCEFKVNKGATVACNGLQEEKKIKIIDITDIDTNSLTILLFNTRSLRRLQRNQTPHRKLYYLLNGKPNQD